MENKKKSTKILLVGNPNVESLLFLISYVIVTRKQGTIQG
jgi:hypothetical protein